MTSLAETVSSAIVERHPEIGTLKKINEVKEYIDNGAISEGKVFHSGLEDAQSFRDGFGDPSTFQVFTDFKTLRKNGWPILECLIRFYLKPRWKMQKSFHAEQWFL